MNLNEYLDDQTQSLTALRASGEHFLLEHIVIGKPDPHHTHGYTVPTLPKVGEVLRDVLTPERYLVMAIR